MNRLFGHWQVIGVFAIAVMILSSHTLYVFQTHQYPEMDEQHYMYMSVGFYKLLQHPTWQTPLAMITYLPFRQPGYPFLILPLLLLFGINHSYSLALWLNGLLFATTIIAIYFLGKELMSKTASFIAALLFACYGWTLFYLHFTYSETAATCFVVLSLLFLVKSQSFTKLKYSLLFGLAFGYGILVRWVVPIFVAGPLLFVFYNIYREKQKKKKILVYIFLSSIIVLSIGMWPYVINKESFGSYVGEQFYKSPLWTTVPVVQQKHFSLQSASYYFKIFEQLNIFFFLLFLAGLVTSVIQTTKKKLFLLITFLVSYLAFSFGTIIKDDRYIVPLYPTIALISASVIDWVRNKTLKVILIIGIVLIGMGSFLGGVWGIGPLGHEGLQSILIPVGIGHPRRIHVASMVWPPTKNYSNADEIVAAIDVDSKKNHIKNPSIVMLFSYHPLDNALYAISMYERMQPYAMQNFVGMVPTDKEKEAMAIARQLQLADYIMIKTGKAIDKYFPENNYWTLKAAKFAFQKNSQNLNDNLVLVRKITIPIDKSTVTIYRKTKQFSDEQVQVLEDSFVAFLQDKNK